MKHSNIKSDDPPPNSDAAPQDAQVVSSEDLFASRREIIILHGAERYRLRLTSNDKLILTK